MKAWHIFIHSVRQVFGNFNAALRMSAAIYVAQAAIALAFGPPVPAAGTDAAQTPEGLFGLAVTVFAFLVGSLWIAVAWHRYVLRVEDAPGAVPPFHGARMADYFVKSILIGLIAGAVGAVVGMLVAFLLVPLMGPAAGSLVPMVVMVPVFVVLYRFSAILPGIAMGEPVRFTAGWEATAGETGTMVGLAAISALASVLLGLPLLMLGGILALLWEFVANWVQLMVGISILTTLYGHYIEKRALV